MNYTENPWFNDTLEKERAHAEASMSKADYENIWLGVCRPAVSGAIYADEIADSFEKGRVCRVPYESKFPVHVIFDLGWNDKMAIILAQRHLSEIRVLEYIEDSHKTLDWYSAKLREKGWNWGKVWLPHDGAHGDYKTGKSAQQIMQELGWQVNIIPVSPVEAGIRLTRQTLPRIYFDKDGTQRLLECLRRYRRNLPTTTNEPGAPVHDEYSHACLVAGTMVKTKRGDVAIEDVVVGDWAWTPSGYGLVTASGPTKYANELIHIDTACGKSIVCTPEHKVLSQRGFIRADQLCANDRLFSGKELSCTLVALSSMVINTGFRATITGEMSGDRKARQTFTERFGSFITARFPQATRFTTRTATRLTTTLATLSVSMQALTSGNIRLSASRLDCLSHQATLPAPALLSGTSHQRAGSGTNSTAKTHGKQSNGIRRIASNVAKSILRRFPIGQSSAIRIARLRHSESGAEGQLVYDLTVRNHGCYQANGVLVSNCDAMRYLCVSAEKMQNTGFAPIQYKRLT